MAGVYKRAGDKARGKGGKWTAWWIGEDGRQKSKAGFTDKGSTLELANRMEAACRRVREGIVPAGQGAIREAACRPLSSHVEEYRAHLVAKGSSARHAAHVAGAISRLSEASKARGVLDYHPERIQAALRGMAEAGKSARTCNHALGALKAFLAWLDDTGKIDRAPRGLGSVSRLNERADRRVERRPLTPEEVSRLLDAAGRGAPVKLSRRGYQYPERWITGPERAMLYRLAIGTGFRANEIRTLAAGRFRLDGDAPTVSILAANEKRKRGADQPIDRDLAGFLRPRLEGMAPEALVLDVPERAAKLLRVDLAAAEIPAKDDRGRVVDFHSLRATYITGLIRRGLNPKIVQQLARHSSITLTMDVYASFDDAEVRKALDGDGPVRD